MTVLIQKCINFSVAKALPIKRKYDQENRKINLPSTKMSRPVGITSSSAPPF